MLSKPALRSLMKERRSNLSATFRSEASLSAASFVVSLLSKRANIALFASMPDEIDTDPLARLLSSRDCVTLYPKVTPTKQPLDFYPARPDDLLLSVRGIREPAAVTSSFPLHQIDAFILPGLAFDKEGARLGFGGGYYDRTLPLANPGALRIGYAFSCQLLDAVPHAPHDQRAHVIVTELGITRVSDGPFLYRAPQGAKESSTHGL